MITSADLAELEYIIDASGVVDILADGGRAHARGRPTNKHRLRLLLLGWLISITYLHSATITNALKALQELLPLEEKIRLGLCEVKTVNGEDQYREIDYSQLSRWSSRLGAQLDYGLGSAPDIDDEERTRRRLVIRDASNAMLDLFQFAWSPKYTVIDSTGIWSPARGLKINKKNVGTLLDQAAAHSNTSPLQAELGITEGLDASALGMSPETFARYLEHPELLNELVTRTIRAQTEIDEVEHVDGDWDPRLGRDPRSKRRAERRSRKKKRDKTVSYCLDSDWGVKTGKTGILQVYFGLANHMLTQVGWNDDTVCRGLVLRHGMTPASMDIVDVSLELIAPLRGQIKVLIGDPHYQYKGVERWRDVLHELGIVQCFDLRKDQIGFVSHERVLWAAGWAHCPATPWVLGQIARPGLGAPMKERQRFIAEIDLRGAYAFERCTTPDAAGSARWKCPAHAGRLGCPLVPGSVATAIEDGLPVIANPPDPERDGEPLPRCCTAESTTLHPPAKVRKLMQLRYWGSRKWAAIYNLRSHVEGVFGNVKSPYRENARRGQHRLVGLARSELILTLAYVVYNLRTVRRWHERTGLGPADHPLLQPHPEPVERQFKVLTPEEVMSTFGRAS